MAGGMTKDEVACVYAALALQDDDIEVTGDKINALLKAANVQVESQWPILFAKALNGVDISNLISAVSSGVGGGGGGGAPAVGGASTGGGGVSEEKKEEKAKEESEESEGDMGFGLFD